MRVLFFTWEFPPLIAGGLAMACYGMVKALVALGVEIDLVIPTKEVVYFPLRTPEDCDTLPVRFLDAKDQRKFDRTKFKTPKDRFNYIGVAEGSDPYANARELNQLKHYLRHVHQKFPERSTKSLSGEALWEGLANNLNGEEDIFCRVQDYTLRAQRYATLLEYDVIHAHDWLCYTAGMIAKRISEKPLVTHIHATEYDRAGGAGDPRIHFIESVGMTAADRVIAVSRYTAEMIISRYRIDTGKVRIVHNAYSVGDELEREQKRIFRGPTILFLGRITVQKGPEYFLEVARRVLKVHPDCWFIMAGSGDMARKIIHRSAYMNLRNHFLFTGFLNRNEVDQILNAVDIYMLPSVSEPFGIAPLEAMAYGVTAVISKQSGVSEVVDNAYKVDFWDVPGMVAVINRLVEDPEECRRMGQAGRREVQQIQWTKAAEKIEEVFNEFA
jgi:glycosyltransferase involved in cell wall biosynthesis